MIRLMKHSFFSEANVEQKLSEFVMNETILSMGKYTEQFQNKFASWQSRKHCIMVNSGSSANLALFAALVNLGRLKKGSKVGVSGVTWSTNIMPIIQLGLVPVLIDVEEAGVNINVKTFIEKIEGLEALFVTNVLGLSNNLSLLRDVCLTHKIQLFEDNCEGLGCFQDNELMGNFGVASTTSSFVGHHFSTIEGGYVFTDDDELAAMLKVVRAHGWTRNLSEKEIQLLDINLGTEFDNPYTFEFCGFNLRPSEINAYCGLLQLPLLKKYNDIRRHRFKTIANRNPKKIYASQSDNPAFAIPIKAESLNEKYRLIEIFKHKNIECRPLISGSMGMQPFWKKLYGELQLKHASDVDNCGLYVTNDPQLSEEEFGILLDVLSEALK